MLDRCRNEQWKPSDLDWTVPPREMSRDDEIAVVQYFTDMAGIELLAAALFEEHRKMVEEPALAKIFSTFVADEKRHSEVAARLAKHYDVHHYRAYAMNPNLERFTPHFVKAISYLSAEIANVYITTGEMILDIALLRSLDDYVADEMSKQAMALINRDESRHLAVDLHMVEYYASPAWSERVAAMPKKDLATRAKAWWAFANVLYNAGPFFQKVLFEPMDLTDPSGRRIKEAIRRIQLMGTRPGVAERPFVKLMRTLQDLYNVPAVRAVAGRLIARIIGIDPRYLRWMYTDAEEREVRTMSWESLRERMLAKV